MIYGIDGWEWLPERVPEVPVISLFVGAGDPDVLFAKKICNLAENESAANIVPPVGSAATLGYAFCDARQRAIGGDSMWVVRSWIRAGERP